MNEKLFECQGRLTASLEGGGVAKTETERASMMENSLHEVEKQHAALQDSHSQLTEVHKQLEAKHEESLTMCYPKATTNVPTCRLCEEKLADSIEYKMNHVVVSCPCGRLYCHKKCADDYLLKEPQCYVCKNYFIYDAKNSALKATIVNRK